ncbi:hypothetical protein Acr_16g0005220 [Actinidia rufa]|uniref:Uncharacterized protein n=1 Tax=Actinidia rufa TaxID=165716 RepID=A0A7J0G0V3_9ERIC|nr:hypothetical protein Acr_16g0005220 [Actinidia rufa]
MLVNFDRDYHCGLIGYQVRKKIRAPTASPLSDDGRPHDSIRPPVALSKSPLGADTTIERRFGQAFSNIQRRAQLGEQLKRKEQHHLAEPENIKRRAGGVNLTDTAPNQEKQSSHTNAKQLEDQEAINLLQENKRLREQCLEYEKEKEELNLKVTMLKREIEDTELEYARMMAELELLDRVKEENKAMTMRTHWNAGCPGFSLKKGLQNMFTKSSFTLKLKEECDDEGRVHASVVFLVSGCVNLLGAWSSVVHEQ